MMPIMFLTLLAHSTLTNAVAIVLLLITAAPPHCGPVTARQGCLQLQPWR